MFSSTPGLSPLEATVGESRHTQNIQINKVTGDNEKCVSYFTDIGLFGQPNVYIEAVCCVEAQGWWGHSISQTESKKS